jgi:hypothetical protein
MSLPITNNRSSADEARERSAARGRLIRKPGIGVFSKELPNTRRVNDDDVRKAGVLVLSKLGDTPEAREVLDMLGIVRHLNGEDTIIVRPLLNSAEPQ